MYTKICQRIESSHAMVLYLEDEEHEVISSQSGEVTSGAGTHAPPYPDQEGKGIPGEAHDVPEGG